MGAVGSRFAVFNSRTMPISKTVFNSRTIFLNRTLAHDSIEVDQGSTYMIGHRGQREAMA